MNGLLEVEAIVPSTGKRHSTVLKQSVAHMSEEDIRKAVERMQALKVYPREKQENQRLLSFATAALMEVDPYRRGDLESAVDHFEQWFHQNDARQFEAAKAQLLMTLSALDLPYDEGAGDGAE